ncbi:prevent-host-death protein [Thiomicrospira aerophila AL3]|uniref:Antitoxin n=1 Tax=Thiomicrospira aerophila AL3 TaxID=717772 RepID=W0DX21_9GAMM|nr:type II toxin-antitoxin system prevent-host-death family antitoxin [Thiomicrospira aerophila]AHF01529.1 prevent-host-death protein [Thiomicrospira aerophila AL3]
MNVSISEFRQHLPQYLKQVQQGKEIQIANRGKVIARLVPDEQVAKQQKALEKLLAWQKHITMDDVVNTSDLATWSHDKDNL